MSLILLEMEALRLCGLNKDGEMARGDGDNEGLIG